MSSFSLLWTQPILRFLKNIYPVVKTNQTAILTRHKNGEVFQQVREGILVEGVRMLGVKPFERKAGVI